MSYIGTTKIGKMYLGTTEIAKAYLGTDLVFQNGLPYTPVEYIEGDGTAYIDTGVKGNAPMSATGKFTPVVSSYYVGCRKDSGGTRFWILSTSSSSNAGMSYGASAYANAIDVSTSITNGTPIEFRTSFNAGAQKLEIKQQGDADYTAYNTATSGTITTGINVFIFAYNNAGTATGMKSGVKCYGVKLYSDASFTTLVFDGVPCYYNGEYGLWDNVSHSFKGNAAGSGGFSGPQI